MNIKFDKEHFDILRKISKNSKISQRNLSNGEMCSYSKTKF